MPITWEQARTLLDAALARAQERGVPSCVAVVDAAGDVVAFAAMDGCLPVCRRLALGKARTSAYLRMPSADVAALVGPDGLFPHLEAGMPDGRLVPFAGGLPVGTPVIGAIGVSGGTLDDDADIVAAAVSELRI